jgi:hypothetical protein
MDIFALAKSIRTYWSDKQKLAAGRTRREIIERIKQRGNLPYSQWEVLDERFRGIPISFLEWVVQTCEKRFGYHFPAIDPRFDLEQDLGLFSVTPCDADVDILEDFADKFDLTIPEYPPDKARILTLGDLCIYLWSFIQKREKE